MYKLMTRKQQKNIQIINSDKIKLIFSVSYLRYIFPGEFLFHPLNDQSIGLVRQTFKLLYIWLGAAQSCLHSFDCIL